MKAARTRYKTESRWECRVMTCFIRTVLESINLVHMITDLLMSEKKGSMKGAKGICIVQVKHYPKKQKRTQSVSKRTSSKIKNDYNPYSKLFTNHIFSEIVQIKSSLCMFSGFSSHLQCPHTVYIGHRLIHLLSPLVSLSSLRHSSYIVVVDVIASL